MTYAASPHEAPRKAAWWRVSFALQDGLSTVYRYTDWTTTVTDDDGNVYASVPSLAVNLPTMSGTLDQQPATIEVASDGSDFFARCASGEPMPPIEVSIWEVVQVYADDPVIADATSQVYHYKGRLVRTVLNVGGRSDAVRFEVLAVKGRLQVPLGIPATPTCPWIFRSAPCGAEALALSKEQTVHVSSIAGALVNLVSIGFPVSTDLYHRGIALNPADGVAIGIRYWSLSAPTQVYLVKPPPASWAVANTVLRLLPACDRSLATCRSVWGQEANFGGCGISIPNYHPVHEIPGAT